MVHPMQQKVCSEKDGLVRQIVINMEKEAVQAVLENRPNDVTEEETQHRLHICISRGSHNGDR